MTVPTRPVRQTADLDDYPDLVVIYLGLRARTPRGLLTILKYGRRIREAAAAGPDGLLRNEMLIWGLVPPHLGMRQYWRDFDSLERWARSEPHAAWWRAMLSNPLRMREVARCNPPDTRSSSLWTILTGHSIGSPR
jgi:hypothetical protein